VTASAGDRPAATPRLAGTAQLAEGDSNQTPRRAAWQAGAISPATRELLDEDARWFLHQSLSTPCLNALEEAEGIWITDVEGRRYMDFHGNSVQQVGFRNARVMEAIRRQLDTLPFSTRRYTNRPAVDLARKLASLAPGDLNRVLFTTGGASANSAALQLARVATGRHKTVSMWDAFHGGLVRVPACREREGV
jgi:4-aminobutyrate aminotransferase